MAKKITLPDIPGARRWVQVNYRILDAFGAREQEGTTKLYTSRWAHQGPFLLTEVILHLGLNLEDFADPKKSRINITWSILPVLHPLSTEEQEFQDWLQKQM